MVVDQTFHLAHISCAGAPPLRGNHGEKGGKDMDHSMMDHPMDGGPAPEGIEEAVDPTYPSAPARREPASTLGRVGDTGRAAGPLAGADDVGDGATGACTAVA